jgi:hypothetical protein
MGHVIIKNINMPKQVLAITYVRIGCVKSAPAASPTATRGTTTSSTGSPFFQFFQFIFSSMNPNFSAYFDRAQRSKNRKKSFKNVEYM